MHRFYLLGLFVTLFGCSGSDDAKSLTREGFCQEWGTRACSTAVVSACQAANATACSSTQQDFCLGLVPDEYSSQEASACLDAVGSAYADADLTAAELDTVLRLGPPCNRVVKGPVGRGGVCSDDGDCDGPGGFVCVRKAGQTAGTCQVPEVVGAGLRCGAAQAICETDFYCDGANCIAAKLAGESCTNNVECGSTAWCNAETCAARLGVDSPCQSDDECLSGVCYDFAGERTCVDRLRLSRSEPICEDLR